jgi:hypothetical protein
MDQRSTPAAAVLLCAALLVGVPGLYIAGYLWRGDSSNSPYVIARCYRYRWLKAIYWPAARIEGAAGAGGGVVSWSPNRIGRFASNLLLAYRFLVKCAYSHVLVGDAPQVAA